MRSHLYVSVLLPLDPETGANDTAHFPVRALADGQLAIHAHQAAEIPAGVEVIRDGRAGDWEWDDLAATHPALYEALCRSERETDAGIVVEYRPPHYWTDDDLPQEG